MRMWWHRSCSLDHAQVPCTPSLAAARAPAGARHRHCNHRVFGLHCTARPHQAGRPLAGTQPHTYSLLNAGQPLRA